MKRDPCVLQRLTQTDRQTDRHAHQYICTCIHIRTLDSLRTALFSCNVVSVCCSVFCVPSRTYLWANTCLSIHVFAYISECARMHTLHSPDHSARVQQTHYLCQYLVTFVSWWYLYTCSDTFICIYADTCFLIPYLCTRSDIFIYACRYMAYSVLSMYICRYMVHQSYLYVQMHGLLSLIYVYMHIHNS